MVKYYSCPLRGGRDTKKTSCSEHTKEKSLVYLMPSTVQYLLLLLSQGWQNTQIYSSKLTQSRNCRIATFETRGRFSCCPDGTQADI